MSNPVLIIFEKNPVAGKVKTRLAQEVGDQEALRIYKILSQRIRAAALSLPYPCIVYFSEYLETGEEWSGTTGRVQVRSTLGERMSAAFREAFEEGHDRIILMGSDIYGLSSAIMEKAMEALDSTDVVLGPAEDGGYYLIGMNRFIEAPFNLASWSHSRVLKDTIALIESAGANVSLLPELKDIDHASDLEGTDLLR